MAVQQLCWVTGWVTSNAECNALRYGRPRVLLIILPCVRCSLRALLCSTTSAWTIILYCVFWHQAALCLLLVHWHTLVLGTDEHALMPDAWCLFNRSRSVYLDRNPWRPWDCRLTWHMTRNTCAVRAGHRSCQSLLAQLLRMRTAPCAPGAHSYSRTTCSVKGSRRYTHPSSSQAHQVRTLDTPWAWF